MDEGKPLPKNILGSGMPYPSVNASRQGLTLAHF